MRRCRACGHQIGSDEGCVEIDRHTDPDAPAPGIYCCNCIELRR